MRIVVFLLVAAAACGNGTSHTDAAKPADAKVFDDAKVYMDAHVYMDAKVYMDAMADAP